MVDLLFRSGAAYELYKRPQNTYDFMNKVLMLIKARYKRVNGPVTHSSSNNPKDHEELLEVGQLSIRLYVEYQEAVDIQEALQCDNALEKENIQITSIFWHQILNPFPAP